jgi:hypothetical protein
LDPIGGGVLESYTRAHACGDKAEGLRREADRVDSVAAFVIPPGAAYAQRQEYERLSSVGPDWGASTPRSSSIATDR